MKNMNLNKTQQVHFFYAKLNANSKKPKLTPGTGWHRQVWLGRNPVLQSYINKVLKTTTNLQIQYLRSSLQ